MTQYNPKEKPDPTICPRKYCFLWRMGRLISSKSDEPTTVEGGCCNPFGVCKRLDPNEKNPDWYETHDPNLEADGLPWFYFIPRPDRLVPEFKERYIEESQAVWGKEHWLKTEEGANEPADAQ